MYIEKRRTISWKLLHSSEKISTRHSLTELLYFVLSKTLTTLIVCGISNVWNAVKHDKVHLLAPT